MASALFNNYKDFSIQFLIYLCLYLVKCILCGNLVICLTKYNHSNLTSKWIDFIKYIDGIIFTGVDSTDYDFNNENDREELFTKLEGELFVGASINKDSPYFENMKNILDYGSTNEVEFDVVIKNNLKKYNLIYFKLNPNYIYGYLQDTLQILKLKGNQIIPSIFLHKFHILALRFNRGLFNMLYSIPEFLILFLTLYNITFGIIISLLTTITYILSMVYSIYFIFQHCSIIFGPINRSWYNTTKSIWCFCYNKFLKQLLGEKKKNEEEEEHEGELPPTGSPPIGSPPIGSPPLGSPPTGSPPTGSPPLGSHPTGHVKPPTHKKGGKGPSHSAGLGKASALSGLEHAASGISPWHFILKMVNGFFSFIFGIIAFVIAIFLEVMLVVFYLITYMIVIMILLFFAGLSWFLFLYKSGVILISLYLNNIDSYFVTSKTEINKLREGDEQEYIFTGDQKFNLIICFCLTFLNKTILYYSYFVVFFVLPLIVQYFGSASLMIALIVAFIFGNKINNIKNTIMKTAPLSLTQTQKLSERQQALLISAVTQELEKKRKTV